MIIFKPTSIKKGILILFLYWEVPLTSPSVRTFSLTVSIAIDFGSFSIGGKSELAALRAFCMRTALISQTI
jgi:hypothetical protein